MSLGSICDAKDCDGVYIDGLRGAATADGWCAVLLPEDAHQILRHLCPAHGPYTHIDLDRLFAIVREGLAARAAKATP